MSSSPLVVLVIVTTYCGNLVAFLTFPKIDIPVNRVMQLLRNDRGMTWSIRRGTFLEEMLMVRAVQVISSPIIDVMNFLSCIPR